MDPALGVALLWLVFGGTHVGLATRPVRDRMSQRLGERGFALVFSLVAAVTFAALVHYYAVHRFEGVAGPSMAAIPTMQAVLVVLVVVGVTLAVAGVWVYPRSPMAPSARRASPYGLARVTRHPFFVGVVLFAGAHALLATRLSGTVLFGGLVLLAAAGAWHQDRKLLRLRGESYAAYLAATSTVPFAAVVAGRQRIVWRELPVRALAGGVLAAVALRSVHAAIFSHGGAWVIGTTVGFAAVLLVRDWVAGVSAARRPESRAVHAR